MKFAVTSFGWNFSQFFLSHGWQRRCLWVAARNRKVTLPIISVLYCCCAPYPPYSPQLGCRADGWCALQRCALSSAIHVHLQGSRHWQPTSRLQSSNAAPGSNVDLSPLSHVIWLNKQDWKCSIRARLRARWPAPPDDDSGHFLTLINSQTLGYKIKICSYYVHYEKFHTLTPLEFVTAPAYEPTTHGMMKFRPSRYISFDQLLEFGFTIVWL